MKWTEGNLFSLVSHWVHCHRIAKADSALLGRVMWTSYESFVANPDAELARLWSHFGLTAEETDTSGIGDETRKYFTKWRTEYLGDSDRTIEQLPPERKRSLAERVSGRIANERKERSLPLYRRKKNKRDFYDALDAAALYEPAIREFGYSFSDLTKAPDFSRHCT